MRYGLSILFSLALAGQLLAKPSPFGQTSSDQEKSTQSTTKSKKRTHTQVRNKAGSSGTTGSAAQTDAQGKTSTLGVTDDARSLKNKTKRHGNVSGQGQNGSAPKSSPNGPGVAATGSTPR